MENKNVPQDNISTYAANKKAVYAVDENGEYTVVASSGWKVEEEATRQALLELERLAREAHRLVTAGRKSPLFFHMYNRRMDLQVLSEATGLFKWRIKRHFKPSVFEKLSPAVLNRYADALGLEAGELCSVPDQP